MPKNEFENIKIGDKARIPDSDAVGWIRTLREAGLSDKEIDEFMTRMNKTWRGQKGEEYVETELQKIREKLFNEGKYLTPDQEKYLKEAIRNRE